MPMATTTHGAPKPAYGDSGSTKATEFNTAQDTFDATIWAAIPSDPSPDADHTFNGFSITGTAGENVAIGDLCYLKTDGKYWKARADAAATMPVVAMATATILADATGIFLLQGYIRNDDGWGGALTVGSPTGRLWVSEATAGLATQTQPATSTNLVQDIGYAVAARIIFFDPNRTLVEVA